MVMLAMATAICSVVCACALIERLPSIKSTKRGVRRWRRNHRGVSASPPVCRLILSVRRRSKRRPVRAGRQRRDRPTSRRRTRDRAASRHASSARVTPGASVPSASSGLKLERARNAVCSRSPSVVSSRAIGPSRSAGATSTSSASTSDGVARRSCSPLLAAVGVRRGLAACRRDLVLTNTGRAGKHEISKRLVEDRRVAACAAQNGPKGVANGVLVGQIHDLERARRVVQLARADAETMIATQDRAEGGQILGQAGKGVHQRRGVETDPKPKSVSGLGPPDSTAPRGPSRIGSRAA